MSHSTRNLIFPEFLPSDDDGDGEFVEISAPLEEDREELIFLIPGIRTDGIWAHEFQYYVNSAYKNVICKPVRGNLKFTERLSTFHLLCRFRIYSFRRSFVSQICETSKKYPDHNISIVAHSMGSSILAEILPEISNKLKETRQEIDAFLIIGGVCHTRNSELISKSCIRAINHVGVRDHICYLSTIIRPFDYSAVGLFGFVNAFVEDRLFNNDHSSCTRNEHLTERVFPEIAARNSAIIADSKYRKVISSPDSEMPRRKYPYEYYVYFRRVAWIVLFPIIVFVYAIEYIENKIFLR